MDDLQVQPLDESGPPAGAGSGAVASGRQGDGGWLARLRDHPRLRALRARRPPYSAVILTSAVLAGTAVAFYMDRPVEEVRGASGGPHLLPESWLNTQVDPEPPVEPTGELARMLSRHPADATLVAPLRLHQENLIGLPPGTYHVRASCSAEPAAAPGAEPARFGIQIIDPAARELALGSSAEQEPGDPVCDGEPHPLPGALAVTGYQAFTIFPLTGFEEPGMTVQVAISFTPAS